jgi:hypothetical protein
LGTYYSRSPQAPAIGRPRRPGPRSEAYAQEPDTGSQMAIYPSRNRKP